MPRQTAPMNTQTHIIMGAALFGRPMPKLAVAGALGGLIPDLPMYAIILGLRASGYPLSEIFGKIYWEHWWQVSNAIGHSFIVWGIVLAVSLIAKTKSWSGFGIALSGSALLHSIVDFLCHRDDAHMHFWPLTEWRFRSPVSYWDGAHYGNYFSLFEAALGVVLVVVLWQRYQQTIIRALLAIAMTAYIAVPAFFIFGNA
jgi:membrane-bound metal-dependent hydrolase YbcI (DUF457 family)